MLTAVHPFTFEATTICHVHYARPILLIVLILAFMAATIRVAEDTEPVHLVCVPGSFVHPAIAPSVAALTLDIIVSEIAIVEGPVAPSEFSFALLTSAHVFTLVRCAIPPRLDTLAMLLIVLPLTFVDRPVEVQVFTLTISFVVAPLTNVDITISMDQSTDSVGLSVSPLALVQATVKPNKTTLAHSRLQIFGPLAPIDHAVFHPVRLLVDKSLVCGHSWCVKSSLTIVDFFHSAVEEECLIVYSRIKDATHFFAMAQELLDLFHALAHEFAAHNRLNSQDRIHDNTRVPVGFLSELGQNMPLILRLLITESVTRQVVAVFVHGRVGDLVCLLADSAAAARHRCALVTHCSCSVSQLI